MWPVYETVVSKNDHQKSQNHQTPVVQSLRMGQVRLILVVLVN